MNGQNVDSLKKEGRRTGLFAHFGVDLRARIRVLRALIPGFQSYRDIGGVPEWLKGTGCKPVGVRLRWFESNLLHHRPRFGHRVRPMAEMAGITTNVAAETMIA